MKTRLGAKELLVAEPAVAEETIASHLNAFGIPD